MPRRRRWNRPVADWMPAIAGLLCMSFSQTLRETKFRKGGTHSGAEGEKHAIEADDCRDLRLRDRASFRTHLPGQHAAAAQSPAETIADPAKILVDRLDLERYKATIKGLTQFGDRKQGTDRNRKAIDWIEAQLKSYGCANIERLKYNYQPPSPDTRNTMAEYRGRSGHAYAAHGHCRRGRTAEGAARPHRQ